jgi:hypothetical protein
VLLLHARRNDHLKHVGLEVLFIVTLLTLPSTSAALPGTSRSETDLCLSRRNHDPPDFALFGILLMMIAGFLSLDCPVDLETDHGHLDVGSFLPHAPASFTCRHGPRRQSLAATFVTTEIRTAVPRRRQPAIQ